MSIAHWVLNNLAPCLPCPRNESDGGQYECTLGKVNHTGKHRHLYIYGPSLVYCDDVFDSLTLGGRHFLSMAAITQFGK